MAKDLIFKSSFSALCFDLKSKVSIYPGAKELDSDVLVVNTTDEDTDFNEFVIHSIFVFRRPIHSRYPKMCTRVSKLMLTRNLRPFL